MNFSAGTYKFSSSTSWRHVCIPSQNHYSTMKMMGTTLHTEILEIDMRKITSSKITLDMETREQRQPCHMSVQSLRR